MPIILYHFPPSAPSRCAYLTAKTLGLDVEVKELNLRAKEHIAPEFIKINPQHTVPTMDDHGFYLWESRAIAGYLVDRYSKDDSLYPRDIKKRAQVDQRLYFDATSIYPRIRNICYPIIWQGEKFISDEKKEQLNGTLKFLDGYLEGNDYVCGNTLTIADISCVASVTSIQAIGWDLGQFKNIEGWIHRCAIHINGFDENIKGCEIFGNYIKSNLAPNQLCKCK